MLNPNLVKFIIKNNLEESKVEEKPSSKEIKINGKMYTATNFAVVPVQVKK